MQVPVRSTIPDSTLTPTQVRRKIRGRGVGDTCIDWADDGTCTYSIPDDWNSTTTIPAGSGYYGTFDPSLFSNLPTSGGTGDVTLVGTRVDGGGDLVAILSNGEEYTIQTGGSVRRGSSGTMASGNHTVTQQQSNAWGALIATLANYGVRLGTVALLQPGASLTPNGTIVGRGQSLVAPGVITSSSLTSTLAALANNPMFLIGGFGVLALAMLAGGGRR